VEEIGHLGEEFVNSYFQKLKSEAQITNSQWESQDNAVSPFDFYYEQGGSKSLLDVKATNGDFERNIHISLPELQVMRDSAKPYYIYRVYEIVEGTAKLRISKPMRTVAGAVLEVLLRLPAGINSDGVSVSPSTLDFGAEVNLLMPDAVEQA
jgi:uncharacterized protein DUF3883